MKKILLTIATLFLILHSLLAEIDVKNISKINTEFCTDVIKFACKELNINNITIVISDIGYDKQLYNIDYGIASTHKLNDSMFIINVIRDSKNELIRTLFHEIYHIKQITSNELKIFSTSVFFKGLIYSNENSEYKSRPYEIEAINMSWKLFKAYKLTNHASPSDERRKD